MSSTILLADDVNMFLELQKGFLKHTSVRVLTARDGAEAYRIISSERPRLVFMDLHMPNMDGATCCAKVKSDPTLGSTPVIMITSAGKEDDRLACYQAGCDGFLTKPIDRGEFLDKARSFIPDLDRRAPRIPCRTRGKFRLYGITLSGEVHNVSRNGCYISADYDVDANATIDVVFALPGAHNTLVQAKGRVTWVNRGTERKADIPAGFGVEFTAITEESRIALDRFITACTG
jgi:CheY-like chemotaxis protein